MCIYRLYILYIHTCIHTCTHAHMYIQTCTWLAQAPRAKMNQQRSRRFRSSKEGDEKREEISRVRSELEARGVELPPMKSGSSFDSNCITPGTTFMARLAICLQYYIHDRMNGNPAWQGIKVCATCMYMFVHVHVVL